MGLPLVSVYARFRAFGPEKQHKYHLCAGSQGSNISFGLLRVVGAAIIQVWGCHFVLWLYSSTMDIRLYGYRAAILFYGSATDFFIYGLRDM